MALHAQARQLARHGRIRTRRSRGAMSGSPHRRQANPRPRSHRMAGPPQQAPRQSRLAIHNRQRPRQAEETVPSVRVTRATRTFGDLAAVAIIAATAYAVAQMPSMTGNHGTHMGQTASPDGGMPGHHMMGMQGHRMGMMHGQQ